MRPKIGENSTAAAARREIVRADLLARPLVIFARTDDELHFVALREMRDVAPQIARAFAAAGRFQIHDAMHARIDRRDVVRAAGFDEHGAAGVAERGHQREHVFLQQRLAAGDLDERAVEREHLGEHLGHGAFVAFVKGVFGVAVGAAQVAESQPHEDAAPARPGALALDGLVDFVDRQRRRFVGHRRRGV